MREGEFYGRNRQNRQRQCAVEVEEEEERWKTRDFLQARRVQGFFPFPPFDLLELNVGCFEVRRVTAMIGRVGGGEGTDVGCDGSEGRWR